MFDIETSACTIQGWKFTEAQSVTCLYYSGMEIHRSPVSNMPVLFSDGNSQEPSQ